VQHHLIIEQFSRQGVNDVAKVKAATDDLMHKGAGLSEHAPLRGHQFVQLVGRRASISRRQFRVAIMRAFLTSWLPKVWSPLPCVSNNIAMRATAGIDLCIPSSISRVSHRSNRVSTSEVLALCGGSFASWITAFARRALVSTRRSSTRRIGDQETRSGQVRTADWVLRPDLYQPVQDVASSCARRTTAVPPGFRVNWCRRNPLVSHVSSRVSLLCLIS
jgi:hypothetical protein